MFSPTSNHDITKRYRGRPPHWESHNATYFVTFRLADSLPADVLDTYRFERQNIIITAQQMNRPLSPAETLRLEQLFDDRIQDHLDRGYGECHLAKPEIAELIANSLRHFHPMRYDLAAWCVMPNHVHVLFRPIPPFDLASILHSWKSFTAKQANILLQCTGTFWLDEYYDHLVRDTQDLHRICHYIALNPIKAGLKNWPWLSTP